jgi:hypothetical protein
VQRLIQPQLSDVARVGLEFAALDLFDESDEPFICACCDPDLFAFPHDMAVPELNLGTPSLHHVLTHRRPLLGRTAALGQHPLLVARE